MEFFVNLPRRFRRGFTGESELKSQAPCQLIFPDGNWSLGFPTSNSDRHRADGEDDEDLFRGPFVVWSDPSSEVGAEQHSLNSTLFCFIFVLDIFATVAIFAYTMASGNQHDRVLVDKNLSPSAVAGIFFSISMAIKFIGAGGVYFDDIRPLTVCFSCGLFIFFVELIWLGSLLDLGRLVIDLFFLFWVFRIRAALLGQWFSTFRLGGLS